MYVLLYEDQVFLKANLDYIVAFQNKSQVPLLLVFIDSIAGQFLLNKFYPIIKCLWAEIKISMYDCRYFVFYDENLIKFLVKMTSYKLCCFTNIYYFSVSKSYICYPTLGFGFYLSFCKLENHSATCKLQRYSLPKLSCQIRLPLNCLYICNNQ